MVIGWSDLSIHAFKCIYSQFQLFLFLVLFLGLVSDINIYKFKKLTNDTNGTVGDFFWGRQHYTTTEDSWLALGIIVDISQSRVSGDIFIFPIFIWLILSKLLYCVDRGQSNLSIKAYRVHKEIELWISKRYISFVQIQRSLLQFLGFLYN